MRILIVEDEKDIRDVLKKSLEAECFVIDEASDGENGLFLALTNEYDLIVLDNLMPKKSGLEVCREIRQEGKIVPILMLSVKTEPTMKADLLNAGADDYITKPYSLEELVARIRALLRRPKQIEDVILKVDNIVLDSKKHTVKRGPNDIRLTRKEFILLEYFIQNKDNVLSRGMIMEHVWDINADPFSNTIESHVLSLRKKIDFKGEKKLIKTIPGRGYKIED